MRRSEKLSTQSERAHVSRAFIWVLAAGVTTVALGCFFELSNDHRSDERDGGPTSGTGGLMPCELPAQPCADDGNPCTNEVCTNGICMHEPLPTGTAPGSTECLKKSCKDGILTTSIPSDEPCGVGLKCTSQGTCAGCKADSQCGETNECQVVTCQQDATCRYDSQPVGTKVILHKLPGDEVGDCQSTVCNGAGVMELLSDAEDVPAANGMCMEGRCVNGEPMQVISAEGSPCPGGMTFCNSKQSCVTCAIDANCAAGERCDTGIPQGQCISCKDMTKNGDESDTDCGGSCGATCKDGKSCMSNNDCENKVCDSGKCIGCFDGVQNNGEAGTDCGGPCALKCAKGTHCAAAADCMSGQCADGVCCNLPCDGVCVACDLPTNEGTCSPLDKGHDDPDQMCSGSNTCLNGACVGDMGKKHFGQPCTMGAQCVSGLCAGQPAICN